MSTIEKNEIEKVNKNALKTTSDRYIDTLSKEAEIVMKSMGLELKPEVKNALFNLGLACEKAIKDKGVTWQQINKDGLASKLLYYAQLNLNPANNELYILPYKTGDNYVLNFEESYLGKKKKVKQFSADNLIDAIAFLVRDGDEYLPDVNLFDGDKVEYKPKPFNDGEIKGAVCFLKFKDESRNRLVEMSLKELEQVKKASMDKMNGKLSPAWVKWEAEMYKKAVLKRALKDIEINVPVEYQEAYMSTEEVDNSNYELEVNQERKSVVVDADYEEKAEVKATQSTQKEEKNDFKINEFE